MKAFLRIARPAADDTIVVFSSPLCSRNGVFGRRFGSR